jgi:hypothetical protein
MIPPAFDLLQEELRLMDGAASILAYSYERCQEIGFKVEYCYDELDRIEAITSRFARLSDILLQRIFRLIDDNKIREGLAAESPAWEDRIALDNLDEAIKRIDHALNAL